MKNKDKAIIYVLLSALGFAFMNLFVKLSGDLPFMQKCFFRNFVAAIFAFVIMLKNKTTFVPPVAARKPLLLRCVFGALGMAANFYAIGQLVIADASMLNKLSPFFAILFSYIFIKEKPKAYQLLCVVVAFLGALFILKPGVDGLMNFPAFIGLLGGAGAGLAYTNVRLATANGAPKTMVVFFFSTFTSIFCLPWMIAGFTNMSTLQLTYLILAGCCATLGQFGITSAYTLAPAKEVSVYDYSMILFAAILGVLFLNEVPDTFSFIGYGIIIGAGVVMFVLNKKADS